MMLKSFEEEQQEMEINMYKYILEGKQHSFPFGYWVETGAKETFKKFLLYYIHEVLGYPKDEIPYHLISKNLIVEAKLISPYKSLFNNRNENLFREMFPEAYPYKMPFITTDLWEGTGEYSGCEPLRDLFPKWYIEEYLGLTEETVFSFIPLPMDCTTGDDEIYQRIISNKYKGIVEFLSYAYPNKDRDRIKSIIKGRTTSRVALLKRIAKDTSKENTRQLTLINSDGNCYYTNSGCNIYVYEDNDNLKAKVSHPDRLPTPREIKFISKKILGEIQETTYTLGNRPNEYILTLI